MPMPLMPAQEGPAPPMMTTPPEDQQPTDLAGALAMVDSIIWRDGGIDQQEMSTFSAWVQQTMMRIQAFLAQQQQMGMMGNPQQQGLGSSGVQDYNFFGGEGGQDLEKPSL